MKLFHISKSSQRNCFTFSIGPNETVSLPGPILMKLHRNISSRKAVRKFLESQIQISFFRFLKYASSFLTSLMVQKSAKHWPVLGFFSKFFKNQFLFIEQNIGNTKWTRRKNRWLLIIGIVTTELVHSFYDVHELFLPRYFNLERLLGLKFFDFCFFESLTGQKRSMFRRPLY